MSTAKTITPNLYLKILISLVCVVLGAAHWYKPEFAIDTTTLGLLVVALLPWFQQLFKSVEIPGVVKIELQDVKAATDLISDSLPPETRTHVEKNLASKPDPISFIVKVAEQDPNLALVGLRIEIEKQLIELAEAEGMPTEKRSVGDLVRDCSRHEMIPKIVAEGLTEFLSLANRAAHGAMVSPKAADWVLSRAPELLGVLSALRGKSSRIVTMEGEVARSMVLGGDKTKLPIEIHFPKPFVRISDVNVAFYSPLGDPLESGATEIVQKSESGFSFRVLTLPKFHDLTLWSIKWKAKGQVGQSE